MSSAAECFRYKALDKDEIYALRALRDGKATESQQMLALRVITNNLARSHDVLFTPGSFDQSAFLAGRGFVGQMILKYLNVPISQLIESEST